MKFLNLISLLILTPIVCANIHTHSFLSCAVGFNSINNHSFNYTEPPAIIPLWKMKDYVILYLYTKEHPEGEVIKLDEGSPISSRFNFSRPTNIITHGYLSYSESLCCTQIRDAFLHNEDSNVIVVDWWGVVSVKRTVPYTYSVACKYVPKIAAYLAEKLNFLANYGMNLNTTTLIGYSLGAHLMGIASSKASLKVGYIVGLDPALPDYENVDISERLTADDATTVHVIHTNEGDCGLYGPMGHYDFYPNGGNRQPGCWVNSCAHSRSYEYYAESISGYGFFMANHCDDVNKARKGVCDGDIIKMNGNVRKQNAPEGAYHFATRKTPPYSFK